MKLINKILDNYFCEILIETVEDEIKFNNFLDVRATKNSYGVYIEVKKQRYASNQYECIFAFRKDKAFANLIDVEKVREKVRKNVEFYLKKERV